MQIISYKMDMLGEFVISSASQFNPLDDISSHNAIIRFQYFKTFTKIFGTLFVMKQKLNQVSQVNDLEIIFPLFFPGYTTDFFRKRRIILLWPRFILFC